MTDPYIKKARELLQLRLEEEEGPHYLNDSLYGAAILLSSYVEEDLTTSEAVQEFIENSDVELTVETG